MTPSPWHLGRVVWREHVSGQREAARAFYGELLAWSFTEAPMPGFVYLLAQVGDNQIAGLMEMADVPPHWMSYVSVADVDAAAAAAKAHGGQVMHGPEDIPGVGRFAVLADPSGAHITAFHPTGPSGDPDHQPGPSEFCWETLNTHLADGLAAFYQATLGWTSDTGMGFPVFKAGEVAVADLQVHPPGMPSFWLPHVVVPKLEAARDRATTLGATVLEAELPVPGVGRLALIQDPAGAVISLFEAEARG